MSFASLNDLSIPVAGWLTKMISLPFGRSRWISRYFVLLDSELRFYKDEHSDSAVQIINLKKIFQVIPAPTTQHPFCFRLEPQQYYANESIRPWIIDCKSETNMETWISAIQYRLFKHNNCSSGSSSIHSSLPSSPKTPNDRIVSHYSIANITTPEFYRVATLPLRCTNLTLDDDEEKDSLLMRRRKKLAPIVTQHEKDILTPPPSSTVTVSPTGAVLGTLLISPSIIDRYSQYPTATHQDDKCESPTYTMYKKKFHL